MQGKMSCLMINDIDAGLGRFGKLVAGEFGLNDMMYSVGIFIHLMNVNLFNTCKILFCKDTLKFAIILDFLAFKVLILLLHKIRTFSFFHKFVIVVYMTLLCSLIGNTQMTVNNQIVVGTLMNLSDNPTRVSIGQDWRESDVTNRIPIIVTGNDFSTIYAPLIRDGRMEKFYWYTIHSRIIMVLHFRIWPCLFVQEPV